MKIKDNYRKKTWHFKPFEYGTDKYFKKPFYKFSKKTEMMKFLNGNISESINGIVSLHHQDFGASYTNREYFVWYNDREYNAGANLRVDLRQIDFRGRKYIHGKKHKIGKDSKKYFAFSKKFIKLMCFIASAPENQNEKTAKKLVDLFYKRGFKDFTPDGESLDYIQFYIKEGIDFFHWSDRCNYLRMKTIIEYFKDKKLI